MINDKYTQLDRMAAPYGYVAPISEREEGYLSYFRKTCQRYNIVFSKADEDEREFVIRMAEKGYYRKQA